MLETHLIKLLRPVLQLSEDANLAIVRQGPANRVFLLRDGEQELAVKWIGEDEFSGINRVHQYSLQQQLAARALAPKPLWLSDDERIWVEQWHTHQLSADTITLNTMAGALATIHRQPITARPLNLAERWQHYQAIAKLPKNHALVLQASQLSANIAHQADDADYCLCHNDLSLGHLISAEPYVVLDWEYSAMGNRYFDLASCAVINGYNTVQCMQLCADYAKHTDIKLVDVEAGFKRQLPVVQLTNALWGAALAARSAQKAEPPVIL